MGFKNSKLNIPVVFNADDGLTFANCTIEMTQMITLVTETCVECRLNVNVRKTQCLIINLKKIIIIN